MSQRPHRHSVIASLFHLVRKSTAARPRPLRLGLAVAVALGALATLPASAKVYLSVDAALEQAFPGCRVDRRTVFLTTEQRQRAQQLARVEIRSSLVYQYSATCNGVDSGNAYFDTHVVRTLPETVMVVVAPDQTVARLEVLEFREPEDYLPRAPWYRQFLGRLLGPKLALRRDIQGVTGATLTARATTEAVRRTLALHRVIAEDPRSGGERDSSTSPPEGRR